MNIYIWVLSSYLNMTFLFNILICYGIYQVEGLSSESIKCYPEQNVSYALVGEEFNIYCEFELRQDMKQPNLIMMKNGKSVLSLTDITKNGKELTFSNLTESDNGIYKFVYVDDSEPKESDPIELIVLPKLTKPTCTTSKSEYYVGDTVTLFCKTYSYPSLNIYWSSDSLPDSLIQNTKNKYETSSIMQFTPNHLGAGSDYTCTISTNEGTRFCTSTVILRERLVVRILEPPFILNKSAILFCMIESYGRMWSTGVHLGSDELKTENRTHDKSGPPVTEESTPNNFNFKWRLTSNGTFNYTIDKGNVSSNLTIENVTDEIQGENITCTVTVDDNIGSDVITVCVDRHSKSSTEFPKSNTDRIYLETNDESAKLSSKPVIIKILIYITITIIFMCIVSLTSIRCLMYLKEPANHNLPIGMMQAIIHYGNDRITQAIPLAIIAPTASITNLGANPSELSLTQTVTRGEERHTLTRHSRPRFTESLASRPISIENDVSVSHPNTVENEAPIIEELGEIFTDPLYDEINEATLKGRVATSLKIENVTMDYRSFLAETSADCEKTLTKEYTHCSYNPEFKTAIKQVSDDEETETEDNDVRVKERRSIDVNSVVLGTGIDDNRSILNIRDTIKLDQGDSSEALAHFEHTYALPIPRLLRKEQKNIGYFRLEPQLHNTQNQTDSSKESNLLYATVEPTNQHEEKGFFNGEP